VSLHLTEARALFAKELRQARSSRGALLSTAVLSLLLVVVVPFTQYGAIKASGGANIPATMPFGGQLEGDPAQLFARLMMPLFVTMAGLLIPSVAAVHTIVIERERRSVELLIALPVRVRDILLAKLAATLALSAAVVVPSFLVAATAMFALGVLDVLDVLQMLLVLVAGLLCSIAVALLVALLARDFRTANNLNGVLVGPMLIVTSGILFTVPAAARLPLLALVLVIAGVFASTVAMRWLTFERYLN
jgi:ABC-type Na+ efflux pump permease subunit